MEQTERPNSWPVANHGTNYYSIITKWKNAHSLVPQQNYNNRIAENFGVKMFVVASIHKNYTHESLCTKNMVATNIIHV